MATINTYVDPLAYRRAATGLESDSLVGLLAPLSSGVSVGGTSLPVAALLQSVAEGDRITIFDGPKSEVVSVTAEAGVGATSISVTALASTHTSGAAIATDGIKGSLSDLIVEASAWLESITQQPRWLAGHIETLRAPTMRAAVDEAGQLFIRPSRFPIGEVSELTYRSGSSAETPVDLTAIALDAQTLSLPSPISRCANASLRLTYTAGYASGELPTSIRRACIYLVSALLADRKNPTGAVSNDLGKTRTVNVWLTDNSGKSLLVKRAEDLLQGEILRAF